MTLLVFQRLLICDNRSMLKFMADTKQEMTNNVANEPLEDWIVEQVFDAIIERQLPPGHKLSEALLGKAFGVGRMHIRRSLLLLANRGVVDLHTHRGAFVSRPSIEEARTVFEARREVEPNITRLAVERATVEDISTLQRHLESEQDAHDAGNRREAIRLSGQFHLILAKIANNAILTKLVRELITRASLIIGIYGSADVSDCRDQDHQGLLSAFITKDAEQAANLMLNHLCSIEKNLNFQSANEHRVDLESVFSNYPL